MESIWITSCGSNKLQIITPKFPFLPLPEGGIFLSPLILGLPSLNYQDHGSRSLKYILWAWQKPQQAGPPHVIKFQPDWTSASYMSPEKPISKTAPSQSPLTYHWHEWSRHCVFTVTIFSVCSYSILSIKPTIMACQLSLLRDNHFISSPQIVSCMELKLGVIWGAFLGSWTLRNLLTIKYTQSWLIKPQS